MKVLLVLPWHSTDMSYRSRYSSLFTYPPLTLGTIAAIIEKQQPTWEIEALDEISRRVDFSKEYDLVMITITTPTACRGYDIADTFRKKGTYVCLGGYHTTYNPDEAKAHADTVFVGPGEYSIPEFLIDYLNGNAKPKYEGGCVLGKDILAPDRSKISHKKYLKYPAVVANPGCPNHCSYCVISQMWREAGARPIEDVIAEIKSLKSKIVIFFDPNFFGDREYSIKLMKEVTKLHIRWAGSATVDVGFDEELLELAKESGCNGLLVGLESLNQAALMGVRKGFNKADRYKEAIENIKNHGIMVNGCFVLGMDHDTKEDLMDLPRQVNELGINLARFSILTPIPGTEMYQKMDEEGRIIDKNWANYTQHQAVFKPTGMTPQELEEIYRYVWKETYSYRNIFKRIRRIKSKGISAKLIGFGANLGFKYLGME
ncbi:B12-binding domain-containing radical SAM protein [Butyrivibrio sp. CB08]|uniref:B12-binding domain-containing radical SAM protein n=1 Tax=Butyrivibrio sp. CB08 TaxID=2364879 RepID=UPI0018F44457|nr:radical SAM protein [Butyrivibrio sp. CB08]